MILKFPTLKLRRPASSFFSAFPDEGSARIVFRDALVFLVGILDGLHESAQLHLGFREGQRFHDLTSIRVDQNKGYNGMGRLSSWESLSVLRSSAISGKKQGKERPHRMAE